MQLVESFLSVQGEGKYSGQLAVFMRFAGCNFNCLGFGVTKQKQANVILGCDTIRAVFVEEFKHSYENLNTQELLQRVRFLADNKKVIVVITGGEPLLHHKDIEFLNFIEGLIKEKYSVHFETNASIEIDFERFPIYKECVFCLGVKLSNSGISKRKRINFKALENYKKYAKDSFYKFVLDTQFIRSEFAQKEIDEIISQVDCEVFCMPLGENEERLKTNALEVAHFCIKNGYNYSDRIHIRIWGDKEGV